MDGQPQAPRPDIIVVCNPDLAVASVFVSGDVAGDVTGALARAVHGTTGLPVRSVELHLSGVSTFDLDSAFALWRAVEVLQADGKALSVISASGAVHVTMEIAGLDALLPESPATGMIGPVSGAAGEPFA